MSGSTDNKISTKPEKSEELEKVEKVETNVVKSSHYYPIISMYQRTQSTINGEKIYSRVKKYYTTEIADEDTEKKKYICIHLIDLPIFETEKDGIYIKPKKPPGYERVTLDMVKEVFPDDFAQYMVEEENLRLKRETFLSAVEKIKSHPYPTKLPDSMACANFEGYLLHNGQIVSAEYIEMPKSVIAHLPYRHKAGNFMYYSKDNNKKIRNAYDPYVHGLKIKKIE